MNGKMCTSIGAASCRVPHKLDEVSVNAYPELAAKVMRAVRNASIRVKGALKRVPRCVHSFR